MGLFSFLKFTKAEKPAIPGPDSNEYLPVLWEDDYCQIEIVPAENKAFIIKQANELEGLTESVKTDHGFTEAFERGAMPSQTLFKKIRAEYLEQTLSGLQFEKAKHIRYNKSEILHCEAGNTKAFGFSNFTIFFDTEETFVKTFGYTLDLLFP
jgi:hypothetical protein